MNNIRKIAVFTSIRSEYGLLKSLLYKIQRDPDLELELLVGGAHLLEEYGNTINEIKNDGFKTYHAFPFLFNDVLADVNTRSVSVLSSQISDYFSRNKVDLIIVLGDRFELLPIVTAALILNIPIGHISGGEVTEGAIDNQVRHAISKMAQLHFTATEQFKNNLIQMGEEDWRICVSGELGLDNIASLDLIPKDELYKDLGLDVNRPVICATFHSETIGNKITGTFVGDLIRDILSKTDYQILVTAANFDEGGREINLMLEQIATTSGDLKYVKSLGKLRYFSLLNVADIVLGNSSSGLVEAQSFNIPVVNVGKRQQGRLANDNVYNSEVSVKEVLNALDIVMSADFRSKYINKSNIYGKGDSAGSIVNFIKNADPEKLLLKRTVF